MVEIKKFLELSMAVLCLHTQPPITIKTHQESMQEL